MDKPLSTEKRPKLRTADKHCVLPPTTAEWLQDNVFLKAIETRLAQLQRQQLEENAGTEPQIESIQTKLTVGEPGDKYEPVADMMASRVMSMPDNAVQRASAEVQTKPANAFTPIVQRAAMPEMGGTSQAHGNIESRLNSSKGGGRPLSADVRGFMEPRFGADFRGVRVHTGSEAVQMNRELGAQAFAHGSNIYFGASKAPGNNELTAHELTHVVQQGGGVQFQQGQNSQKHQDAKAAVVSLTSLVQQNVIAPRIQRWVLPTDWLDYIGLTVDAAERIYIELKYKEGQEKDFKRFVNNLFIAIDLVFAAAPGAGGGGLALRASHSSAVVAWAATPDSLKLKIAAEVAKRMGWPVTRALQMANIYFSATAGSGKIEPLAATIQSEKLLGNTKQVAIHLARLLRLSEVGGRPPGEDPDDGKDNDKHWWKEIKTFLKNIQQAIKGGSRKQVMRELLRKEFTEEQIIDIEKRLIEAAKEMGENPPPFLPPS